VAAAHLIRRAQTGTAGRVGLDPFPQSTAKTKRMNIRASCAVFERYPGTLEARPTCEKNASPLYSCDPRSWMRKKAHSRRRPLPAAFGIPARRQR
jgi:hypothetical protein